MSAPGEYREVLERIAAALERLAGSASAAIGPDGFDTNGVFRGTAFVSGTYVTDADGRVTKLR